MKHLINPQRHRKTLLLLAVLGTISSSSAATITFGDTWSANGLADNNSAQETITLTQDNLTFELTLTAVGGKLNYNDAGTLLGIDNTKLDINEKLTFTLEVTAAAGFELDSISLNTFTASQFAGAGETAIFGDGSTTQTLSNPAGVDYDDLTELTELSKSTLSTWQLSIEAGTDSIGSMDRISFDYSVAAVPEPSSSALLGLGGLSLALRRRR